MTGDSAAELVSTDGWTRISLNKARSLGADAADVFVTTRFWERGVEIGSAELEDDADTRFSAIALDSASVRQFAEDLARWVSLPLKTLSETEFVGEYELAAEMGQVLTFGFKAEGPGRVLISVEIAQERLTSSVRFESDATACESFATGLRFCFELDRC